VRYPNPVEVSVIIPTYKPKKLQLVLDALFRQNTLTMFEIIIVSRDRDLERMFNTMASVTPVRWVYLEKPGISAARNFGVHLAAGKTLVFLDDDCIPASDWLRNLLSTQQLEKADVVSGPALPYYMDCPYNKAHQAGTEYLFRTLNADGQAHIGTSMNLLVDAAKYRMLGGFDETFRSFGEDFEFNVRYMQAPFIKSAYADKAIVRHAREFPTFRSLLHHNFQYGKGDAMTEMAIQDKFNKHVDTGLDLAQLLKMIGWTCYKYGPIAAAALAVAQFVRQAGKLSWNMGRSHIPDTR
jgi:glycosyltransferase involved in cell wall biosynthesis